MITEVCAESRPVTDSRSPVAATSTVWATVCDGWVGGTTSRGVGDRLSEVSEQLLGSVYGPPTRQEEA